MEPGTSLRFSNRWIAAGSQWKYKSTYSSSHPISQNILIILKVYQKAILFLENNPALLTNNWFYLNMLMMLAYAYEQTGQSNMAQETYRKILKIEKDFKGVTGKIK